MNLQANFRCRVHEYLGNMGLKGCIAYDCFGAGQKTFGGQDWSNNTEAAEQMFAAFLIVRRLHEMLWYLEDAYEIVDDNGLSCKIEALTKHTDLSESIYLTQGQVNAARGDSGTKLPGTIICPAHWQASANKNLDNFDKLSKFSTRG